MKLFAIGATLLALAACNTVEGVGRDLQQAGTTIEKAVHDRRDERNQTPTPNPAESNYAPANTSGQRLETVPYERY